MKLTNKKVLVTGADGFIGSHLVEKLLAKGARVRAFTYYNSFNSWGWIDTFPKAKLKKLDVFAGDVRDPNGVEEACKGVDVVFHLAALIGIPFSYHSPDSYVDTNIKGTLNVLQAARKLGVKKVIHTSTSEIYGTAQYTPIDEAHPINPQSPYAATKAAADTLCLSFYRSFGLPVTILRPFNTFGPRQSARAIIPTILTQIYGGAKTIKLGSLDTTRDLNFITNTVDAFLRVAESSETTGQVFNCGSGREASVAQVVDIIKSITKSKLKVVKDQKRVRPKESEVMQLLCDAGRLHVASGWKPGVSLEQGIKVTADWVKKNIRHYKANLYNI